MDKHRQIKRNVYTMVAINGILIIGVVALSRVLDSNLLLACGFPVLLSINYLFLRRKPKTPSSDLSAQEPPPRQSPYSLYVGSVIFFMGTLIGLATFVAGELPLSLLPVLLFPLSLAIYFLRVARRVGVRKG